MRGKYPVRLSQSGKPMEVFLARVNTSFYIIEGLRYFQKVPKTRGRHWLFHCLKHMPMQWGDSIQLSQTSKPNPWALTSFF